MGCCSPEVAPSPKVQNHSFGLPVEVSVNWTASGARPAVTFAVKSAVGGYTGSLLPNLAMKMSSPYPLP